MAPTRQRTTVRLLLYSAILILAAGTDARSESATQPLPDRPNILFALADDWGWPHAGAYGNTAVETPTFDRLAREGTLFEHAYVSSPSCTPCRNSILTGQQFYRLGEGANLHSTLDVRQPNFMMLLRSSGYQIGHWRKAWGPGDFKKGGYSEHPCGPGSRFDEFLKHRDPDKPFCFWFGTSDPHRPYQLDSWRQHGVEPDEGPGARVLPRQRAGARRRRGLLRRGRALGPRGRRSPRTARAGGRAGEHARRHVGRPRDALPSLQDEPLRLGREGPAGRSLGRRRAARSTRCRLRFTDRLGTHIPRSGGRRDAESHDGQEPAAAAQARRAAAQRPRA